MTHAECIETLLTPDSTAATRQTAKEHVARCSDCWIVLSRFHERVTGAAPEESDRMAPLFGCDDVTDRLHVFVGVPAAELSARHPSAARHLSWCHACRGRLAEMVRIERAEGTTDPGPAWRRVHDSVWELVGRITVGVREAAAGFLSVPDGVLVMPPKPAMAFRGDNAPARAEPRELRFPVGDGGLTAELRLEAEGGSRIGLVLRLLGVASGVFSVSLRSADPKTESAFARFTVRGAEPVALKGLEAGPYVLEVLDRDRSETFRIAVDIGPAA